MKNGQPYLEDALNKAGITFPVFCKPVQMVGSIEAKKITNRVEFTQ